MAWLSSLLGTVGSALLGGVANKAANKATNWISGANSNSNQSGATDLWKQYYNDTKNISTNPYVLPAITGENVAYEGMGDPAQINPAQAGLGTLDSTLLGNPAQTTQQGYTAQNYGANLAGAQNADYQTAGTAQMGPAAQMTADNIQSQQIASTSTMSPAMQERIRLGQMQGYEGAQTEASLAGDPSMVQDNAAMRAQLEGNLDTLNKRAQTGFDEIDTQANNKILQEGARQSTRQQNAIMDDMRRRGVSGGGQELVARMQADQGSAAQANNASLALANEQRNRKNSALTEANASANNIRNTDIAMSGQNAQMQNQNNQFNANANNQNSQFNANSQNQSNQFNAQSRNQATLQQGSMDANRNAQNQNASNQANQFNAGAQNQTNQMNAQLGQQANLANQGANNQASQFNAGAQNDRNSQNAQMQQQNNQFNANAANQNSQFNTNANNQNSQFNANSINQASQNNANAQNQANQWNAGAQNQGNLWNAQQQNQFSLQNNQTQNNNALAQFNAYNQNQQFNTGQQNQANQWNAGAQNQASQWNAEQGNNQSRDNANINNATNLANQNMNWNMQTRTNDDILRRAGLMGNAVTGYGTQLNAEQAAQAQRQYAAQNTPYGQAIGKAAGGLAQAGGNWLTSLLGKWFEEGGYAEPGKMHIVGDDSGNPHAKPEIIIPRKGGGVDVIPNNAQTKDLIDMMLWEMQERDKFDGNSSGDQ